LSIKFEALIKVISRDVAPNSRITDTGNGTKTVWETGTNADDLERP